ncbi:unnamed protein product [Symbiodinium natans]|uniref:Uncharacterized protein n=1 Tax=Symbiodinium natans TaxID=878477 RepID=A0A812UP29_9DINO|nr:unnamed protein product [Symbiodinium natans]
MLWFMKKDDKIRHLVLLFTLVTLFLLRLLSLAVFHNPLESLGTEQRALSLFQSLEVDVNMEVTAGLRLYVQEAQELYRRFSEARQVMSEIQSQQEQEDEEQHDSDAEASLAGVPQLLKSFDPLGHYQILPGDFLMTHPISCIREPVFDQAVVILHTNSDHPLTDSGLVRGLVLNKRLNTTFKQLLERAQDPQDKNWAERLSAMPASAELRVFRGGPVIVGSSLQPNLEWVHSFPEISEAQQVSQGVWFGGKLEEILERAAACEGTPPVRIMLGYSAWSTLQLQIELECGVWCRARAPQDAPQKGANDAPSVSARLCFAEEGAQAWKTALLQAGQDLLAHFPRAPGIDTRIRGHMKRHETTLR